MYLPKTSAKNVTFINQPLIHICKKKTFDTRNNTEKSNLINLIYFELILNGNFDFKFL